MNQETAIRLCKAIEDLPWNCLLAYLALAALRFLRDATFGKD